MASKMALQISEVISLRKSKRKQNDSHVQL